MALLARLEELERDFERRLKELDERESVLQLKEQVHERERLLIEAEIALRQKEDEYVRQYLRGRPLDDDYYFLPRTEPFSKAEPYVQKTEPFFGFISRPSQTIEKRVTFSNEAVETKHQETRPLTSSTNSSTNLSSKSRRTTREEKKESTSVVVKEEPIHVPKPEAVKEQLFDSKGSYDDNLFGSDEELFLKKKSTPKEKTL